MFEDISCATEGSLIAVSRAVLQPFLLAGDSLVYRLGNTTTKPPGLFRPEHHALLLRNGGDQIVFEDFCCATAKPPLGYQREPRFPIDFPTGPLLHGKRNYSGTRGAQWRAAGL